MVLVYNDFSLKWKILLYTYIHSFILYILQVEIIININLQMLTSKSSYVREREREKVYIHTKSENRDIKIWIDGEHYSLQWIEGSVILDCSATLIISKRKAFSSVSCTVWRPSSATNKSFSDSPHISVSQKGLWLYHQLSRMASVVGHTQDECWNASGNTL